MEIKFAVTSRMFDAERKVLFITDKLGPSYYLSCHFPFLKMQEQSEFSFYTVESSSLERYSKEDVSRKFINLIRRLKPNLVVFSRVQDKWALDLLDVLKELGIASVFFIDDNWFSLPESKDELVQNRISLLEANVSNVKKLLASVDHVWCSTTHLQSEISRLGLSISFLKVPYPPYCVGRWDSRKIVELLGKKEIKIGYYGSFLHRDDLTLIVPDLLKLLKRNSDVSLEFFGNVGVPEELAKIHNRFRYVRPVRNYLKFRKKLKKLDWSLSLAPLRNNAFNLSRSPIKFFESTAAGIPFLSSDIEVYSPYVASAAGPMASDSEWFEKLSNILDDRSQLVRQVESAHKYCSEYHGIDRVVQEYQKVFSLYVGQRQVRPVNLLKMQLQRRLSI